MNIPHQKYRIDLNNINEPTTIAIEHSNDKGVRFIDFELWADGKRVTLPAKCSATATFVTDGILINSNVECTISENRSAVQVPIDNSKISTKSGIMAVEITITDDTGNVLTPQFSAKVKVKKSIKENAHITEKSIGTEAEILKEVAAARGDFKDLPEALSQKANKSTTLDGYGITDGEKLNNKVSKIDFSTASERQYPSVAGLKDFYDTYIAELSDNVENLSIDKADKSTVDAALSKKTDTDLILKRTKNLIRLTDTDTFINGLHIIIKNNRVHLQGTATADVTKWISAESRVETYKKGVTYTASAQNVKVIKSENELNGRTGVKLYSSNDYSNGGHLSVGNTNTSTSFTPADDITGDKAKLLWNIPAGEYDKEFDLMLEIGSEPTAFEPYYVVSNIENGAISYNKLNSDLQTEFKKIPEKADKSDTYTKADVDKALSEKAKMLKFEDITNAETGCYWNAIPHNSDSNWECIAEPIPCSEGDIFRFTAATVNLDGHQQVVKCYDSNKKLISTHHGALEDKKPISYTDKIFVVPSGVSYVVFNCWKGEGKYSLKVEKAVPIDDVNTQIAKGLLDESPTVTLYGKSIYSDGDSIAQGAGSNGVSYAHLLRDKYNMTLTSKAVGGTTIAVQEGRNDSIYERITAMTGDYDVVLFDGGTNDVSFNVPTGTMTNSFEGPFDTSTTLGALEAICQFLNTHYFEAQKLFIVVNSRISGYYNAQTALDNQIKKVLRKWSIPWVDISAVSGFGNWNDTVANEYFLDDKLHPKLEAYKRFYLPYIDSALRYGGYINTSDSATGGNHTLTQSDKSEIANIVISEFDNELLTVLGGDTDVTS